MPARPAAPATVLAALALTAAVGRLNPGSSVTSGVSGELQLNVVCRVSDQNSVDPWQPGSTLNWAETLFCDPGGPYSVLPDR